MFFASTCSYTFFLYFRFILKSVKCYASAINQEDTLSHNATALIIRLTSIVLGIDKQDISLQEVGDNCSLLTHFTKTFSFHAV